MKRIIFMVALAALFSINAFAHQAFTLVSSQKKTVKESEVAALEKQQTAGIKDKSNLTLAGSDIRLVGVTGPEDDMLSYRIQGVRNPNLVVPAGAKLTILFVNVDADMRHDIRFGHVMGEFPIAPDIAETAGTEKLTAKAAETLQAEEIVIKANENGAYKYFCSVRGHAKGGMWGNILVGVKPGDDLRSAPKVQHVHSADEENDDHQHPAPAGEKPPGEKKPGEMGNMPGMDHQNHQASTGSSPSKPGDMSVNMAGMNHSTGEVSMEMRSTVNVGDPMSREGSGTSWVPDSSPMNAWMKMYGDGSMLMVHGVGFLRYTSMGSSRDASVAGKGSRNRFDAPTMFMAMYSKPIGGKGQLGLRTMFSLDPIIERGYGYPLLYQSGELFHGEQLHDRQHPHDFISELAATYSYKLSEKSSFYVYAGLPGEPALGPVMYLHRPSGANNPNAPIGHHWQDASHITFGVLTAGYSYEKVKFEVSAFNGTEPDENRWAFDRPKIDSFSGRLSFNPTKEWAFQVSYGYLKSPERSEPELKVLRRTTASAMYNKQLSENKNWSNTFVWGQNHSDEGRSNSFLFESNYEFYKNSIFGRAEQVQKNAHELVLPAPHPEGNQWVQAYSIGYLRDIVKDKGIDVGVGGMLTANFNPSALTPFYGGTSHGGWQLFMRFRPSKHGH
jgi:plastocyanin